MVAAVDWLLEQKDETLEAEYMRRVDVIKYMVKDVPTMKASVHIPEVANHVPHLMLTYDPDVVGISPKQVQERLRQQRPSIELNPATGISGRFGPMSTENTLVIGTWMLQPGEAETVGQRIRTVLMNPKP
jgi:L-seryl-tRNA(Ser) seleniumtransferase